MISKNKIMDSFEEFIKLPLSILRKRIIQITGFKSDFVTTKSIDVDVDDEKININVVNSDGAYNLLSSVVYKRNLNRKKREENSPYVKRLVDNPYVKEEDENSKSKVYLEFAKS